MAPVEQFLANGTLVLDIAILAALLTYLLRRFGKQELEFLEPVDRFLNRHSTKIAFLLALVATGGSLYFSNVLGYEPCRFCWFQRIFMYPLVLILGAGLILEDRNVRDYVIPLAVAGIPIAFYHSLMQRFEQFHSAGCSITAVSCSTEYTFHYGYITIPVMSLTAFTAILLLVWRFGGNKK